VSKPEADRTILGRITVIAGVVMEQANCVGGLDEEMDAVTVALFNAYDLEGPGDWTAVVHRLEALQSGIDQRLMVLRGEQ
jgi:hypothetical protein